MPAKKPEPRRSSLSAEHPYAPPQEVGLGVEVAPSTPALAATPRSTPDAASPAVKRQAEPKGGDKKPMSVRATLSDQARIRAAFMATNSAERHGSLSDFITRAALEKVAQLERQYNDGEPWPAVDAGDVPTGRPLG